MGRARGTFPNAEHAMEQEKAARAQIKRLKQEIQERRALLVQTEFVYRRLQRQRRKHARTTAAA